jgi:cellulose synthase operon protein C
VTGAPENLAAALLDLLTEDTRRSLANCAAVRFFDVQLYESHLMHGGAKLADLRTNGWVSESEDGLGRFSLAPYLRDAAWNLWWSAPSAPGRPAELVALTARLARHYQGIGWPVEQLRQLVISDVEAAARLFDEIYQDADDRFDLARCQDAVDALTDFGREPFLNENLADRRPECERRVWARSTRTAEFLRTADDRYQPRRVPEQLLEPLAAVNPGAPWLLQIHGKGGTGKTTLLARFIARSCLTSRPIVACARIDGDAVNPVAVLEFPWLLLLEAAAQLNRQLPEGPFFGLLGEMSQYRRLLRRSPLGPEVIDSSDPAFAEAADKVETWFCQSLAAAPRILIIFDAMDYVVERGRPVPDRLNRLFKLLERVHQKASQVQVILAGRENLSDFIPALQGDPADLRTVEIGNFSPTEAAGYLRRRGIDDQAKIDAVIGKSKCVPYAIAGLADVVRAEPMLKASDIQAIDKPLVDFLNERILDRIYDPIVGWSLRFSIVPPVLSIEFFTEIMLPLLRAAPPNANCDIPDPDDAQSIERLWQNVVLHADKSTWMASESSAGQKLVVVNSEVVRPLRASASAHADFRSLHDRALAYYLGLSTREYEVDRWPTSWLGWTKAAVFHAFHCRPAEATGIWRTAVARARRLGRLDWAKEMCEYLLGPDLHDHGSGPDFTLVSYQAVYEAQVESAYFAAQRAGRLPGPDADGTVLWPDEAVFALAQADRVLAEGTATGSKLQVLTKLEIVRAAVKIDLAETIEPEQLSDLARLGEAPGEGHLILARHARQGLESHFEREPGRTAAVLAAYQQARDSFADDRGSAAYAEREAAIWLLEIDEPEQGLEWALNAGSAELCAEALLGLGRPASALATLSQGRTVTEHRLAARAALALRRPVDALSSLARAEAATFPVSPATSRVDHQLLLAVAYGDLLEIERAEKCFALADSLLGDTDEENRARVYAASGLFQLRIAGNKTKAASELGVDLRSLVPGSPGWTDLQLARTELADQRGTPAEVRRLLADLDKELWHRPGPASRRIRGGLAALAATSASPAARRSWFARLTSDLALVSAPARLAMLENLRRCQPADDGDVSAAGLRELILTYERAAAGEPGRTSHAADDDADMDKAWQDLTIAQLFRVTGSTEEFRRRRDEAVWPLRTDPYLRWELMAEDAELGTRQVHEPSASEFEARYGNYPVLLAAFITEWADQYDDSGRSAETGKWLSKAENLLAEHCNEVSRYLPRLLEVQVKRAVKHGDHERAEDLAATANEGWAALGDDRRIMSDGQPGRPERTEIVTSSPVAEVVISAARQGRAILISSRRDAGAEERSYRVGSDLTATALGIGASALDWGAKAGRALASGLRSLRPPADPEAALDVTAEFVSPRSAAVPWELASIDQMPLAAHPGIRFFSRTVPECYQGRREVIYHQQMMHALSIDIGRVDGIAGPMYREGIAHLQRRYGGDGQSPTPQTWRAAGQELRRLAARAGRPITVMLVQPLVGGNLDSLRRLSERMRELRRCYQSAFPDTRDPAAPGLRLLSVSGNEVAGLIWTKPGSQPVDVLHVCTVMEATEQMPVLGLDLHSGPPLRATALDQIVQRMTGTVPPLVILDVQAPPSPVDVRRQLLLRNTFAHQLLGLDNVDTVIATGLEARRNAAVQWNPIARGLADGRTAAAITRQIQRVEPPPGARTDPAAGEAHAVACTASAFFTNIHPDVLRPPGLLAAADASGRSG